MRAAKCRGKRKGNAKVLEFFAQPFDIDANGNINEMRLIEDAHLPASACQGVRDLNDAFSRDYDANQDSPQASKPGRLNRRNADILEGPMKRLAKDSGLLTDTSLFEIDTNSSIEYNGL